MTTINYSRHSHWFCYGHCYNPQLWLLLLLLVLVLLPPSATASAPPPPAAAAAAKTTYITIFVKTFRLELSHIVCDARRTTCQTMKHTWQCSLPEVPRWWLGVSASAARIAAACDPSFRPFAWLPFCAFSASSSWP